MSRTAQIALTLVVAACNGEVGITMELGYDPEACGGCPATEAVLPAGAVLALEISDFDSDEVVESRCFSSNQAATVAQLPERLRDSEFNDIVLPGGRTLFASFEAHPPEEQCGQLVRSEPLLEATSAPVDIGDGATTFRLVLACGDTPLCE
jgi:hypothetical protein